MYIHSSATTYYGTAPCKRHPPYMAVAAASQPCTICWAAHSPGYTLNPGGYDLNPGGYTLYSGVYAFKFKYWLCGMGLLHICDTACTPTMCEPTQGKHGVTGSRLYCFFREAHMRIRYYIGLSLVVCIHIGTTCVCEYSGHTRTPLFCS